MKRFASRSLILSILAGISGIFFPAFIVFFSVLVVWVIVGIVAIAVRSFTVLGEVKADRFNPGG